MLDCIHGEGMAQSDKKSREMTKAEMVAVSVWRNQTAMDWVHSRAILMGAKIMCDVASDDYQTLDFLWDIAGVRIDIEFEVENGRF